MESAAWQKAKPILAEALELPVAERSAFVRLRCEDPAECAEIMEYLDGVRTVDSFLATQQFPVANLGADGGEADLVVEGSKVGPYVVLEKIGHGGMGQVFLATDPRLQRRVALKCLLDTFAGEGLRFRILEEARAAAKISSEYVAAVHDVVELDDTRAFIVMEYVDGESLFQRLRHEKQLKIDDTLKFARQLAAALSAAHAKNIVHRDLKPANIQLTWRGSVKVLDFGIAHDIRRLTTAASSTTTTPRIADIRQAVRFAQPGTPPYMSLEQLLGRPVDERSDIYSLGVVLFEMCTGRRPYAGSDAAEIAAAQLKGVPRADEVNPDVPPAMADVIARAMATDAAKRYQTADEVGLAIDEVAQILQRQTRRELVRRWVARIAVGAPITIAALGVLGFLTSVQFKFVFGLDGEFSRFGVEPWTGYFTWGLRATAPVLLVMALSSVLAVGVRFVLRVLTMAGPIRRVLVRLRDRGRHIETSLGLDNVVTFSQALIGLGVVTLALFCWSHAGLIQAWSSFFNSAPIARLMPMTDSAPERNQYEIQLSLATLVFGFGFYKVLRMRARQKSREGRAGVVMLGVLLGVMVLLNAVPWRTLNRRNFPRIDSAGAHCYITGRSGDEYMVLCPGSDPPRNRVVRADDPRWHVTGDSENVFKGVPFRFVQ